MGVTTPFLHLPADKDTVIKVSFTIVVYHHVWKK